MSDFEAVRNKILIIEDEEVIRESLSDFFAAHGYSVQQAATCSEGERLFRFSRPDLVVCDFRLPDGDALRVLETFRRIDVGVPLIVATAHASIELAVHMIKEGAVDFITKPLDMGALRMMIERHLEAGRCAAREQAADLLRSRDEVDPFIGVSRAIGRLRELAHTIADTDAAVLIGGETGTGKGVLARWLHAHSRRAKEAFVDVNSAGLSRELLESELFGHEKGSFTGAQNVKRGLLEVAHRGTVFLDEIGEIDVQLQPKLLKVLEEKRFRRVGDVVDRTVDIRLIAATHRDLAVAVRQGSFRSDLFFRINTLTIVMPPLRERPEDIPMIADDLLRRMRVQIGKPRTTLTSAAVDAMRGYAWPGNIRELKNVIERALLLTRGNEITPSDLRFDLADEDVPVDEATLTLEELAKLHVRRVLDAEEGSVDRAARRLGIPRSTLYRRLREWSLVTDRH